MPDIAMCKNESCPSKLKCYRYTTKPSRIQSYAEFKVSPKRVKCNMFISNIVKKISSISNLTLTKESCPYCQRPEYADNPITLHHDPLVEGIPYPAYLSNIYYAVAIGSHSFLGWTIRYIGLGRMEFYNSSTDSYLYFYCNPDSRNDVGEYDWIKLCWEEFISTILPSGSLPE